jgi:hypothetical protein
MGVSSVVGCPIVGRAERSATRQLFQARIGHGEPDGIGVCPQSKITGRATVETNKETAARFPAGGMPMPIQSLAELQLDELIRNKKFAPSPTAWAISVGQA